MNLLSRHFSLWSPLFHLSCVYFPLTFDHSNALSPADGYWMGCEREKSHSFSHIFHFAHTVLWCERILNKCINSDDVVVTSRYKHSSTHNKNNNGNKREEEKERGREILEYIGPPNGSKAAHFYNTKFLCLSTLRLWSFQLHTQVYFSVAFPGQTTKWKSDFQ